MCVTEKTTSASEPKVTKKTKKRKFLTKKSKCYKIFTSRSS